MRVRLTKYILMLSMFFVFINLNSVMALQARWYPAYPITYEIVAGENESGNIYSLRYADGNCLTWNCRMNKPQSYILVVCGTNKQGAVGKAGYTIKFKTWGSLYIWVQNQETGQYDFIERVYCEQEWITITRNDLPAKYVDCTPDYSGYKAKVWIQLDFKCDWYGMQISLDQCTAKVYIYPFS